MSTDNDEDYDELPSITVNSSTRDASVFAMPSAEELASQRAREELCERELRAMRECERDVVNVARVSHSDSSGSEGEVALAAAVGALNVQPPPVNERPPPGEARAKLLRAARAHLPPQSDAAFIDEYLQQNDPRLRALLSDQILSGICSLLACDDNEWSAEEVVCVGAWLCAACVAAEGRRGVARRALHVLLDDRAAADQVDMLGSLLVRAWRDCDVLMAAGDCARGGGGGGQALAAKLLGAALAHTLRHYHRQEGEEYECGEVSLAEAGALVGSEWRRLDAGRQERLVRLLGRALAATSIEQQEQGQAVLAALAAQPWHASNKHTPEHLKVLVNASKLQLLFYAKK